MPGVILFITQHIEHILAIAGLLWLICQRNKAGFGLVAVFWGIYFFLRPENTGFVEAFGEHPLSAYHIWLSWSARIFIICAAVHEITAQRHGSNDGLFLWGDQAPYGAMPSPHSSRHCETFPFSRSVGVGKPIIGEEEG